MSSDKRDFAKFHSFPGEINNDTDNYEFPKIYKEAIAGKVREWAIYVRLIKEDSKSDETRGQNWNLLTENQIPIKDEYLAQDSKLLPGTLVEMWTESGVVGMKISRSAATYIFGKNIGKKNERNSFQQALITARGKYLKKIDEGSKPLAELTKSMGEISVVVQKNIKFHPMLAKNYKDFIEKVTYPVYIQPKLDGLRCLTYLNHLGEGKPTQKNTTIDNVIMYSRQMKDYPDSTSNNNIREALLPILIKYWDSENSESVFLDGELYKNNVSLQKLNSSARGDNGDIEYHVYDLFYPSYTTESFAERTKLLADIHVDITTIGKKYIKQVPTHLVKTKAENDRLYETYLEKKYEGTMIRTPSEPYLKSSVKKSESLRSKHLLKRKEVFSEEFEVVDYTSGTSGKEIDAIVWICDSGNAQHDTFNVVPNWPHKERYAIFKECKTKFETKYEGRMLTCEFRGLSDNQIPLQVKAIEFRDVK